MVRMLVLFWSVLLAGAAVAERRVALVIGNATYERVGLLANPSRDADAVAEVLQAKGFEVMRGKDLALKPFRDLLKAFRDAAEGADVALVYYAGHGIEMGGVNYLVPTDAALAHSEDTQDEAIALTRVREAIAGARRLRVVVLDACRDNPFLKTMKLAGRDVPGRGLAAVRDMAAAEIIAFAAGEGAVASDGAGGNSPFAAAFVRRLADPGIDVRFLFGGISDDVRAATGQDGKPPQMPAVYAPNLGGGVVALVPGERAQPQPDPDEAIRRDFANAKTIGTVAAWDSFLSRHANGPFAVAANAERQRLAALQKPPVTPPPERDAACAPVVGGYRVTGVGSGDVLNIRGGPGTETPILFVIPPDGSGIERLACPGDGRWCRIRHLCREGWALARLLAEDGNDGSASSRSGGGGGLMAGRGYRVTGVDRFDTLKVRQSPTGESAETGSLPPDARGVEVLRCIAIPDYAYQWCLMRHQSLYGWVYGKYLAKD